MTESDRKPTGKQLEDPTESDRAERLSSLLRTSSEGFRPGFADRVMARLEMEASAPSDLAFVMCAQFRRWAPVGLAAGLALAAFNVSQGNDQAGQSTVEALLGLEPVTLVSAYSIEFPSLDEDGAE